MSLNVSVALQDGQGDSVPAAAGERTLWDSVFLYQPAEAAAVEGRLQLSEPRVSRLPFYLQQM